MIKLTVLYGTPSDAAAFEQYYANTHMPLVYKIPGLGRTEKAKVVGTPSGEAAPYCRIFEFRFDSQEHMGRVLGSAEGQAVLADVPNFATGGTTVLISQVED